jgi:hypothetical protein
MLGRQYITKVATLNFGNLFKCPYIMNACLMVQMMSPPHKIEDGFGKLVKPAQLVCLTSKANIEATKKADELLANAREVCTKIAVPDCTKARELGRLDSRVIMLLIDNQGILETTEFESLEHIAEDHLLHDRMHFICCLIGSCSLILLLVCLVPLAMQEFLKALNNPTVSLDSLWTNTNATNADAPPPKKAKTADTIDDMRSISHQLKKQGYDMGQTVSKKKGSTAIYIIKTISDEKVELEAWSLQIPLGLPWTAEIVSLTIDELMADWKLWKGKLTEQMEGLDWKQPSCIASKSTSWQSECLKGAASIAMRKAYQNYVASNHGLTLMINPDMVMAIDDYEEGELTLVAASTRIYVGGPANKQLYEIGKFVIEGREVSVCIGSMFLAPVDKDGKPNSLPWVVPFWKCRPAKETENANLKLSDVSVRVDAYTFNIPVFTNCKNIKKGDELLRSPTGPAAQASM